MTPKHLKAVIHHRRPLHEGFLRVYQYEFDVEKHEGGSARNFAGDNGARQCCRRAGT